MTNQEIERLIAALGDAPRVTYAPPNIYPMSAPVFEAAVEQDRGAQPAGPIGVYAHVPFCHYKCTFCFYATTPVPKGDGMTGYVEALETELEWLRRGTELSQLYVGGGTPTALPAALLERLLQAVFSRVTTGTQVNTVECSPDSLIPEHVAVLKRNHVGRVSMGVQTGEEGVRANINRQHGNAEVRKAIELLVGEGLVVNVDLIYGLPGQKEESFEADFRMVSDLGVHSLTVYNLRVNEKTPIGRQIRAEDRLDTIRLVRWRELAGRIADDLGFERTRWHTYRRLGPSTAVEEASRFRDVTGWGNQLGVGNSARSRLGDVVYRNVSSLPAYRGRIREGRSPVEESKPLDAFERRLRFVTLTLGDGSELARAAYQQTFGNAVDEDFGGPLERLTAAGVVEDDGEVVTLTSRGKVVYDLATRAFYPDSILDWMAERQALASSSKNLRGSE